MTTRVVVIGNDVAMQTLALKSGRHPPGLYSRAVLRSAEFGGENPGLPAGRVQRLSQKLPVGRWKRSPTRCRASTCGGFAGGVSATTLINAGPVGSILEPDALRPVSDAVGGEVTVYASERSSYKDGLYQERWIADKLGLDAPILPEHWQ